MMDYGYEVMTRIMERHETMKHVIAKIQEESNKPKETKNMEKLRKLEEKLNEMDGR